MPFEIASKRYQDESSRDYAYRILRRNIVTLRLEPGAILSEPDLSELLGMSRTPIHEALILLKNEGLVDILPQRGSKVSHISLNLVKEGYFMRQILESAIIREIAGTLPPEHMKRLRSNIDRQVTLVEQGGVNMIEDFFKLDDEFHCMLFEFSYKERIWLATHSLNSHYDRVRFLDTLVNTVDLSVLLKQHNTLYYYLLMGIPGDVDIAKFCTMHQGRFLPDFQHTIEAHPGYFVD